ncbi:ATP-binding response regulator [Trichlorobacter ammonificans]|uniref:histidine kinase n=1 Tax=Trichlorobacter ammonificans TaxID=2916410 RepID=A0ABM9D7P5_9BACT|nr:response regulator [Trichlorobacter ammonificans]CAH2031241.1 putative Histidine kinase [Trichlorobacter ammonificans]
MSSAEQDKPKALIVDDDAMVLQMVAAILELHGFETWRCSDVTAACTLLEQVEPDVLLTDIRMPGRSGTDLLKFVQEQGGTFPVIVMTGYTDFDTAIDAVKGNAFDFIRKPFDPQYLVQAVKRAVEHYRLLALEREYRTRLEREVQQKTMEILQASRLKSEFLHNISHEIRTPANGIVGMLSLARETEGKRERDEYLGYAEFSARQLVRIVDDLVTFSGIVTGSLKPSLVAGSADTLINRALDRVTGGSARRDLAFEIKIAPDIPERLLLETTLLEMALFQLFENEMKFAVAGSVSVQVDYDTTASLLVFDIRDSGPGIPAERLKRIKEPFVQGDGSHTRPQGGLGIGLSIVARTASCLGGSFTLDSSPEGGSRFVFSVPAQPL